jgi:pyridoxine 5-phosphate synthase
MPKLGVNVDHVATLRQARLGVIPSPVEAALVAEKAGADGIVVHLREDRRHIQEEDVEALLKVLKVKLNLEMALNEEIIKIALKLKPYSVCLVPERRKELTTEGGLEVVGQKKKIKSAIKRFHEAGIKVSIFVDPIEEQIQAIKECGADALELHTGKYAEEQTSSGRKEELRKLEKAAKITLNLGLHLHAGHGLDYHNVVPVAQIPGIEELNIGFSIIARAIFVGLEQAVREMKKLIESSQPKRVVSPKRIF